MSAFEFRSLATVWAAGYGLLLVAGCSPGSRSVPEATRSVQVITAVAAGNYSKGLQGLADAGVAPEIIARMKSEILQTPRLVELRDAFVQASIIGELGSLSEEDLKSRIGAATNSGYRQFFWEINSFGPSWSQRYDRELTNFPAPPVAVLNIGPGDTNFINYFKWFDRYAERLHSVVINADKLDNYDFKKPEQQAEANRVMSALYRLIKARQPEAFVWVRVVWADDRSDLNWLKALSFEPDGLVLWNLPAFESPFGAAQQRYRPLVSDKTPFLIGAFYGFWPLLTTSTNQAEIGRSLKSRLPGFRTDVEQMGYRGLAADWLVFKSLAQAQTNLPMVSLTEGSQSKRSKRWQWTWAETAGAYGQIGQTNAAWDNPVRQALELYTDVRTGQPTPNQLTLANLGSLLQTAIAAGCNDPLVHHLHTRYSLRPGDPTPQFVRAATEAAEAMEASRYSEVRKFLASWHAADAIGSLAPSPTNWPPEMERHRARAEQHLIRAVSDHSIPEEEVRTLCQQWLDARRIHTNQLAAYQRLEPTLFEYWPHGAWAWLLKARAYIAAAWEARGTGWGNTVTEKGWQRFGECLAVAEQALDRAWTLDPTLKEIAEEMITVELGQGRDPGRMEFWFRKAMQIDTNDYNACLKKLYYLEPKWHGSPEAMIAFGRSCVASKQWGGQVPLILLRAHETIYGYIEGKGRTNYWKQPEVWPDLQAGFEKFFQLNPTDTEWRQSYFLYAFLCEQWDVCNRQLALLTEVNHNYFGGLAEYERMVRIAKEHQPPVQKTTAPNRRE